MRYELALTGLADAGEGVTMRADGTSPLGAAAYVLECGPQGGAVAIAVADVPEEVKSAARYIVFDVYHEMGYTLGVELRIAEGPAAGTGGNLHITLGVLPGLPTRLSFPMSALDGQTVFLPRTPGRLKATCFGTAVDAAKIECLSLGMPAATGPQRFWVSDMALTDVEPTYPMPEKAVVDELGQWTAKDWPGKTQDVDQLVADLKGYVEDSADVAFPEDWSCYGGWTGKKFGATGFFRTHHDGRRWWLVDPEGCAFFSAGIDCMGPRAECRVLGNESLFAWLPPVDGRYADAWGQRGSFNFSISNAIRAWGDEWKAAWNTMTAGRMRDWGFNTIANWSDPVFYEGASIPYVWQPGGFPATARTIYRDFPDVFSDEYLVNCRTFASGLERLKDDPFMIGYFMRNEPLWAFGENNLAEHLLASGSGLASLDRLIAFLSERYSCDMGALNTAWGTSFCSFAAVAGTKRAAGLSEASSKDLWDFTAILVRQYLEPVCKACRQADPNHLNLGIRYAWLSSEACLAGSDLFDVFSINMYQMGPTEEVIRKASEASGLPVMIGEYHWGALDRGLPSTGLRGVPSQAERGVAYQWYLERGAAMPWLVGAHYFQLNDQPVLGRFDGENFQIGFVDICQKPYEELVCGAKKAHRRMYLVADGQLSPTDEAPVEVPRQGF